MVSGLKGQIEGLSPEALIQAVALSGQSGVLTVSFRQREGRIYFRQGKVVGAETPERQGKEAFFEILSWQDGEVSFVPKEILSTGELGSVEALLMEAATHQSEKGKGDALSVLLVEDSPLAARTLSEIIESSPNLHLLEVLSNGEEALWAAAEYNPDVILLDLNLPGLTGSKAFKYLMIQHPAPIVLTSSRCGPEGLSLLLLGATAFCKKSSRQAEHLAQLLEKAARVRVNRLRRYRLPVREKPGRESSSRPGNFTVILSGIGGFGEALEFLGQKTWVPEEAVIWVVDGCPELAEDLAEVLRERLPWETVYVKATTIVRGGTLYISSGIPAFKKGPVLEPNGDPERFWNAMEGCVETVVFSGVKSVDVKGVCPGKIWIRDPESSPAPDLPGSFKKLAEDSLKLEDLIRLG
ncbi:response regulator [Thermosulfurimonas sp. F29]|uniref:response regulator n=1 Tax=Thermosulfurimonas sp. F29 TaxID=2867247 RepID=UPI001C83C8DE|nr:DUF4388 domain-containing protein [Thermosulfurimonas sp. F29]MBX6422390.1 DUF4388 domain-containing protein [Thermosulfurimonas sp. F29]